MTTSTLVPFATQVQPFTGQALADCRDVLVAPAPSWVLRQYPQATRQAFRLWDGVTLTVCLDADNAVYLVDPVYLAEGDPAR